MDPNNQVFNFSESYPIMNEKELEYYKTQHPHLAQFKCVNNILYFNNESFQLGYFLLNQLPTSYWTLEPHRLFNIIRLAATSENNIKFKDYFAELVNKPNLNEDEKNTVIQFINIYLALAKEEDLLFGTASIMLSECRRIINDVIYLSDPANLTDGQNMIKNNPNINVNNDVGGRGNSYVRVLKNPNFPSTIPNEDENDPMISRAGFASIILILYSLINAAIILAIHLIK